MRPKGPEVGATEWDYLSAKTLQNMMGCFFNGPLWYLRGPGISPATIFGVMGIAAESLGPLRTTH